MDKLTIGLVTGIFAWILNAAICFAILPQRIESDVRSKANAALKGNGLQEWSATVRGMDVDLKGPRLQPSEQKSAEEELVRDLILKTPGVRSIGIVRYVSTAEVAKKTGKSQYVYFSLIKAGPDISIRGELSNVSDREDASEALRAKFGSLQVQDLTSIDADLIQRRPSKEIINELSWISEIDNFILEFDGKHVVITGELPNQNMVERINKETQQAFGSEVTVENKLLLVHSFVEKGVKL